MYSTPPEVATGLFAELHNVFTPIFCSLTLVCKVLLFLNILMSVIIMIMIYWGKIKKEY